MTFLTVMALTACLILIPLCVWLFGERARAERELRVVRDKLIVLETRREADGQMAERMQVQLREEFGNTATKIFEEVSGKFTSQSEKQIGNLLSPLRERLGEFQKKIDESFGAQAKEQYSLKNEIQRIVLQAEGLAKALRGDVKAQGNWGEIILERVLEASGLRRNEEYIVQGEGLDLRGEERGIQRPDVIITLPDNKHIIVDSKVSLVAYERYCNEADDEARQMHLKEFIASIRAHVKGLESKRYQDNAKLGTPDFVLLFMPIEGAFSLATQAYQELHSEAWSRRIILVSPTTLFATLKTVASLWRIEAQNRNAQDIAAAGSRLYDKFVGFCEDMVKIGSQIDRLGETYAEARKKLSEGRGNLVSQVEDLRKKGVKGLKTVPKELMEIQADAVQEAEVIEPFSAKQAAG